MSMKSTIHYTITLDSLKVHQRIWTEALRMVLYALENNQSAQAIATQLNLPLVEYKTSRVSFKRLPQSLQISFHTQNCVIGRIKWSL